MNGVLKLITYCFHMGLTKCPDCDGKVSDSASACPHCGRPMKKPEVKSDPRISKTSSGGRIYCTDCKGHVNPNKQAGRKSNLYIKADLPGAYDPMVRMPDGRPEYYCPICNARLYGEPESYGSSSSGKATPEMSSVGQFFIFVIGTVGLLGVMLAEGVRAWWCVGSIVLLVIVSFLDDLEVSQGKKSGKFKPTRKYKKSPTKRYDGPTKSYPKELPPRSVDLDKPSLVSDPNSTAPAPASSAKDKLIVEESVRKELRIKPKDEVTKENLAKVTRLYLVGTKITDVGLKEVVKLRGLKSLYLSKTQITNRGLKDLANMQQLEKLKLNGTQITDAGLKELVKLQNLQTLYLGRTQITNAAVAELKKALPNCNIIGP